MADGPTAKKALSKTFQTGNLNYNASAVMKKEYGNKIKATGFYLYQTSAQIAIKTFPISVQFKLLYLSQQVIRRVIKH